MLFYRAAKFTDVRFFFTCRKVYVYNMKKHQSNTFNKSTTLFVHSKSNSGKNFPVLCVLEGTLYLGFIAWDIPQRVFFLLRLWKMVVYFFPVIWYFILFLSSQIFSTHSFKPLKTSKNIYRYKILRNALSPSHTCICFFMFNFMILIFPL